MVTRYATDHLVEAQFEPGSRGRVLKNLLGIRGKRQMDAREALRLAAATDWAIRHVAADQRFTASDICRWHKQWLGDLYPWAGAYRQVNISKGSFVFAMSAQVPRLMQEFERMCWRAIHLVRLVHLPLSTTQTRCWRQWRPRIASWC